MILDELVDIGEDILIEKNGKIIYEGKYLNGNPYANIDVVSVGAAEEVGNYSYKLYTYITI